MNFQYQEGCNGVAKGKVRGHGGRRRSRLLWGRREALQEKQPSFP